MNERFIRYQFVLAPGTGLPDPSNAARGFTIRRVTATQVGVAYSTQIIVVNIKDGKNNRSVQIPSGQSRLITPVDSNVLYGLSVSSPVAGDILVELEGEQHDPNKEG